MELEKVRTRKIYHVQAANAISMDMMSIEIAFGLDTLHDVVNASKTEGFDILGDMERSAGCGLHG